ncbi:hypothetical protein E4U42_007335 [Claviceps africana]|uniref:RED-like N-terminal domain-containing protein n=1 Tax=Claviceps africana TaxID=83212 RepID=A0A8K0J6Z1_9HYPO|nr:hypothetical protein E4U42_007335 [Claviceps africana]
MNNEQFRKLMLDNSASSKSKHGPSPPGAKPVTGSALGSRQRSSIPMTPRSVAVGGSQASFAQQVAERDQSGRPPSKKFKTAAPRGVRLGQGYVDRTQGRQEMQADEREARLRTLEESYRKEEIDKDTYEKARFQIAGGDLESTHLVKGLDFKLLERVRRGEDVYNENAAAADAKTRSSEGAADVDGDGDDDDDEDDEFDQLASKDVQAPEKPTAEKQKKKGQLSTVITGKKRTRDQILAELKAARAAAKAAAEPALGDRFRKIGTTQKLGTRIERDRKGREVLIIVDADGHEKRKVRKLKPGEHGEEEGEEAAAARNNLPMPDKNAAPLGMEVPEQYRKAQEVAVEEDVGDVDIFDDVGDDYNPLAGMDDSGSGSGSGSDEDDSDKKARAEKGPTSSAAGASTDTSTAPKSKAQSSARNYFQDAKTGLISEEAARGPAMSDPAIMAAIKKAATLRRIESEDDAEARQNDKDAQERRKRLLQMAARDDDDLDMGFGTSRLEDEEDLEDHKLETWGGEGGRGGKPQRKRGPKKRKGDANSAADVLRVMEQRKKS